MKIINHFNPNETEYEVWFKDCYLKSLGLINRKINDDFEGIICSNNEEIAFFELKLVTLANIQGEINEQLKKYENSEYLHALPKQKETKSRLLDIIAKASKQVLSKQSKKRLLRIIYLIRNTADFCREDIIDVIKSNRQIMLNENGMMFSTYGCAQGNNSRVLDLFNNKDLSGLICLTIKSEPPGYISEIIKNRNANISIPNIFIGIITLR